MMSGLSLSSTGSMSFLSVNIYINAQMYKINDNWLVA